MTPFSSATEAGVSVAKVYAAIHQFGGQAGRGRRVTIPARPYLPLAGSAAAAPQAAGADAIDGLQPEAAAAIGRILDRYLSAA